MDEFLLAAVIAGYAKLFGVTCKSAVTLRFGFVLVLVTVTMIRSLQGA